MAAYEGGQYVGRPSLRPVRGFFGSSGVPPGIGRNDEEDDVDVSPSEAEIFVAALVVARCCCCRCCSSCFFSARAAFFLLLTKCCTWCCAAVVVVANDISLLFIALFLCDDVFSVENIYPNARTIISRLSPARARALGQKNERRPLKNEKENATASFRGNRVLCFVCVLCVSLSKRAYHQRLLSIYLLYTAIT